MGEKEDLLKELEAAKRAIEERDKELKAKMEENVELRRKLENTESSKPEDFADTNVVEFSGTGERKCPSIVEISDSASDNGSQKRDDADECSSHGSIISAESENSDSEESNSDITSDDEEIQGPSDELEAIRRHAARTLVWANSAIKRSSTSNLSSPVVESAQTLDATSSSPSSLIIPQTINFTCRDVTEQSDEKNSDLYGNCNDKTPETQSVEESFMAEFYRDSEIESQINDSHCDSSTCSSFNENVNPSRKKGPFAGIKEFLEEKKLVSPKPKQPFNLDGMKGVSYCETEGLNFPLST